MTELLSLFFAMLTIAGGFAVVLAVLGAIASKLGSALPGRIAAELRPMAMVFAFVIAASAMAGSLYYSEVAGYDPCKMCWRQRYCMYPAALILGAYLITKKRILAIVGLVLAAVGLCISIYHRLEQAFPDKVGGACELTNPCSGRYVNEFGFVTIPTMAGVAFALVLVLILLARPVVPVEESS